jgi:hypothetical protein
MPKTTGKVSVSSVPADPIAEFFGSWRLWLLGALIGTLLAWGVYQIFPPAYRARATVVVDNNLEEAWQFFPDRQLFQFLQRETERLEQLAWSDTVLQKVAQVPDLDVQELRAKVLQLSQPSDGGWHFYANDADPAAAQLLAATWAQAFVDAAHAAVEASPEMQAARDALDQELQNPNGPDSARVQELAQQIAALDERTKGISIYTELYVSEAANLPTERSLSLATYLLVGSAAGALALPLYVLLRPVARRRRA